jgi:tetratricopeptide (TPR) repeat protein
MLARLELDVQENPGEAHPLYFLHRQYLLAGQYQRAIDVGMQYLRMPGPHDRCEAFANLALACERLGQTGRALVWLHNALAVQPERRVWWLKLAELYYNSGQPWVAMAYLHGAQVTPALANEQHAQPGINDQSISEFIHLCEHRTNTGHTH